MDLSKNFTLEEMTISQEAARSGIKNIPDNDKIENLRLLCENILQPLRDSLRKPIVVNSGFRSVTINRRIGGSQSSQHCKGQAADIVVSGMTPVELMQKIRRLNLPVDQCIEEFGQWVHVSYGPRNRREYLKARIIGGKTVYLPA